MYSSRIHKCTMLLHAMYPYLFEKFKYEHLLTNKNYERFSWNWSSHIACSYVVKEFLSRSQKWSLKKCERFSWNWSSHIVKEFITTMGDKSVETLGSKIRFLSVLITFPPFPPKQCWFLHFFDCTDHSAYTILNWGAVGIRELTLDATKIEQKLKYQKASFP